MRLLVVLTLGLCLLPLFVACNEQDLSYLSELPLSSLKMMLLDRGEQCEQCAIKEDYVKRLKEVFHYPHLTIEEIHHMIEGGESLVEHLAHDHPMHHHDLSEFDREEFPSDVRELSSEDIMKVLKEKEDAHEKMLEDLEKEGIDVIAAKMHKGMHHLHKHHPRVKVTGGRKTPEIPIRHDDL
jgi:hypothetical protein